MFSIGFSELIVIAILAIILFKPNDWLDIIKNIKRYINKFKEFTHKTKQEIFDSNQINEIEEIKNDLSDLKDEILNINGKNYIYGEDGKLYETFSLQDIQLKLNKERVEFNKDETK